MTRALVITRVLPGHGGGSQLYLLNLLEALSDSGINVSLLPLRRPYVDGGCLRFRSSLVSQRVPLVSPGHFAIGSWQVSRRLLSLVAARLARIPPPPPSPRWEWVRPVDDDDRKAVTSVLKRGPHQDWVIVNYAWLAELLPEGAHVRTAVITHDVLHRHVTNEKTGVTAERERDWLARADLVVAISEADRASFRALLPASRVVTAPVGVPARPDFVEHDGEPGTLLFVGSSYAPNILGLRWFLGDVWPLVLADEPSARLVVCGDAGDAFRDVTPDGVELAGRVPDLADHYAGAQVVIVPIREGTGMKVKLVEALAFARPVVAAPEALAGIEFLDGDGLVVAATPRAFANAVLSLLRSPRERRALRQQAAAAHALRFSPEAACAALANELRRAQP